MKNKPTSLLILVLLTAFRISFGQNATSGEKQSPCFDFIKLMQPIPQHARLEQENWYVWGASVLEGDDGRYHMVYCRWPKDYPFADGWLIDAQLCYATSDSPTGPFEHQTVVLRGMKYSGQPNAWDGASVYNPHLKKFDGKYYLYYTGTNDPLTSGFSENREVLVRNQCIGVVAFNSFGELQAGRFVRGSVPLLKPLSKYGYNVPRSEEYGDSVDLTPANIVVVNPSVLRRPDGKYILAFKGWQNRKGWATVHGVAVADSPVGPFRIMPDPVFRVELANGELAIAEDPFIWYSSRFKSCFALVKDYHGDITGAGASIALFRSDDGICWHPAEHILASDLTIAWANGSRDKAYQLERPQLLLDDDGNPLVLYAACALKNQYDDRSVPTFNIHIPLAESPCRQGGE